MIRALPITIAALSSSLVIAFSAAQTQAPASAEGVAFFESKVRPLLVQHCLACHSDKTKPPMGGLRLDSKAAVLAGGGHGPAVVPGNPQKSLLIQAIQFNGTLKMPPAGKLPDAQIAILTEWVKMGAPDPRTGGPAKKLTGLTVEEGRKYWAFQRLRQVTVPAPFMYPIQPPKLEVPAFLKAYGSLNKTVDDAYITYKSKTPIDRFIFARLGVSGLRPNLPADRRTLIRRAYFDLIGLPPTPQEVDAFLNDKSPKAWEKLIDKLLASPHYGERWGRHWLDLARFAESHGYEQDYDRPYAYFYRDFVIKALNQDLPYNTFVKWQLAGDEFEPENQLALQATGFLAAGTHATQITKNQVEKERYDELDDMLSTTGTAMLGLTFGCARCHSHKYDAIPQDDYYRMLATFTTTVRSDFDVNTDPVGYGKVKSAFDIEHEKVVDELKKYETGDGAKRMEKWLVERSSKVANPSWYILEPQSMKASDGVKFEPQIDGSYLVAGALPDNDTYTFVAKASLKNITALRLEALADPTLVKGGPGRAANGNFALSDIKVGVSPTADAKPVDVKLKSARADFEQKGLPVAAAIDGDAKSAWAVDPELGKSHAAAFEFQKPVGNDGPTYLTVTLKFENNTGHSIGRPRLSVTTQSGAVALDAAGEPERANRILNSIAGGMVELKPDERNALINWAKVNDGEWNRLNKAVQDHLASAPKPPLQKMLISSEGVPAVRTHTQGGDFLEATYHLRRGDPNQKDHVANQAFLQVLERTPDGERHWVELPPKGWHTSYRRKAYANWIADVDNGGGALLARVIVNRLWQHHMGRGIVATPSDFGVQGERPTHPELLDWLASELIRSGWRLKPIHKLIMTSAVYMQSSAGNARAMKIDNQNKLCWRHPKQRLEAEVIRDTLLSVSGQLEETMFGPGTLEESMKRRSIYFFVKRSKLIPSMMLFDAPNALLGLGARATTTVAPQALMLMNSPLVRTYAEALAKRIGADKAPPRAEVVMTAYDLCFSRPPTASETADSFAFLNQQLESYRGKGNPDAVQLALTDFCQALFGLNEFVYVE